MSTPWRILHTPAIHFVFLSPTLPTSELRNSTHSSERKVAFFLFFPHLLWAKCWLEVVEKWFMGWCKRRIKKDDKKSRTEWKKMNARKFVVKGNDKKEERKVRVRKSSKRISDVVSLCVRYKFATHILFFAGLTARLPKSIQSRTGQIFRKLDVTLNFVTGAFPSI